MDRVAITRQYKAAEKDLFCRIDRVLQPIMYTRLAVMVSDLYDEKVPVATALMRAKTILQCEPSLYNELEMYLLPGTSAYIFTTPGEPMLFRPSFEYQQLALPWDIKGDRFFSTSCAICMGPFCAPIRTLTCKHTFCQACLYDYLECNDIHLQAYNSHTEVQCPYCRQTSSLGCNVDCEHERSHNSLLLTLQDETLKYACPVEECKETFTLANLKKHVEVCPLRKYVCNIGCAMIFPRKDMHQDAQECIQALRVALDELRMEK